MIQIYWGLQILMTTGGFELQVSNMQEQLSNPFRHQIW